MRIHFFTAPFLLWRGPYTEAAAHGKEAPLSLLS